MRDTVTFAPGPASAPPRRVIPLDLGLEPPIEADGQRHGALEHRRVSLRWLAGTVLTAFSGGLLIAAAVSSALDTHPFRFALPEFVASKRESAAAISGKKGDRLVRPADIVAAKQTFKTPVAVKSGDKEVLRARTFTRIATTLTLTPTAFADAVPPFNPLKMMGDSKSGGADQVVDPGMAQDDAEVSFSSADLAGTTLTPAATLSIAEVQAQVTEHLRAALDAGRTPQLALPSQLLLMKTSRAGLDAAGALSYATPGDVGAPFSTIKVRMVPENVTEMQKAPPPIPGGPSVSQIEERLVLIRKGETLEDVLRANGATRDMAAKIVAAFAARRGEQAAGEGQRVKLTLADWDGAGGALIICRVAVYSDETLRAAVAITDAGNFVEVSRFETAPTPAPKKKKTDDDDEGDDDSAGGMRLYDSLYETALKQNMPKGVIDDLVRIFANDVDFQRSVQPGDTFEAFYDDPDDQEGGKPDLLYASINVRGETFRYYRFLTPDDGLVDFYDPNGRSIRKFLLRKPIAAGELRSGFGMRYHPILRYSKMHTGVDWANATGTPILAAGNGTVISAGWDSGYGRRIEIQHANGYITTYNHQSGFAKGIAPGVKVRQGQVIGYLGSTGLATGPHLHYEVMVNGRFVDPLQIRLPRTREFDGRMLADFKREKDRIDGLMAKAPNATAQVAAKPPT